MSYRVVSNFTEFSDDILLHIFSFLSSWDLLNVLDTCDRFNKVGKDHSLWRNADFNGRNLTASQISRHIIPCLQSCTKYLHFKGQKRRRNGQHKWKIDILTPTLMTKIGQKCCNLQDFCLSEAAVDAKRLKLAHFGELKNLQTLSIIGCEFINLPVPSKQGSYFRHVHTILPKLQHLEVSKCNWVTDYDLMVLSKLDGLKKLILKCDLRIGYTIAYLSISFRFGFKSLEELDLRGTSLQETDVPSVVQSGKLKSLLIGPIGKVRRLNNEYDDGLNLVISDPHRREESRHQVVVINMGPNGPQWRQANDEELDKMGLQWVKNGLNQHTKSDKDEEHYFFGKEGKIVKNNCDNPGGECSTEGTSKAEMSSRKRKHSGSNESDTELQSPKKFRADNDYDTSSSEDEEKEPRAEEVPPIPVHNEETLEIEEEKTLPDKYLSDYMITAFKDHSKHLLSLVLAGCAITDEGLLNLVRYVPSLKYIDISATHITMEGVQQAKLLLPECEFISKSLASCNER